MKKINNKRGISLIVLVITIVVMIVLATAIILSIQSSGIIGKANEAKEKTDMANAMQIVNIAKSEWLLGENENNSSFKEYAENKLNSAGFLTDNSQGAVEVTEDGKIYVYPKIPKGFVASNIEGENTVENGLVIYEGTESTKDDIDALTTRNQYVWVPVNDMSEFVLIEGYSSRKPQTMVSGGKATEPFSIATNEGVTLSSSNDLTGEYAEYASMKASVEKYGGFYIARYEAGTTNQRTNTSNGTSLKNDETTPDVLFQKDKYPYGFVGWGTSMTSVDGDVTFNSNNQGMGAVSLARSIYPSGSENDVVSTLCYGVQWDAIMHFLEDVENSNQTGEMYIKNSTGMGWYSDNYSSGNPSAKTGIDVENSLNKVKNIYDLAGNMLEWTMEANSYNARVMRGGTYSNTSGLGYPASHRKKGSPAYAYAYYGFRVALYLK